MPLSVGSNLGPYQIIALIGAGGMGEVYRARDTRLNREVAIKVCAERFSDRFEREAHSIAALNHPNICTLHDVGPNYLVMELVEGSILADRIKERPLPLDQALGIASQMADALDAAHEKGIVHRDLKPGNIKIKPDGTVKVLDFGLAKMTGEHVEPGDPEKSPTITIEHATRVGAILGTAAYMSPEQARGKSVDKRADIWAFGVVLYEMLTGKHMFRGETITDVLSAVVKEEPDLSRVPTKVQRLLKACLQKDSRLRLQAIGDWKLLLDDSSPSVERRRNNLPWAVSAVLLLGLISFTVAYFRRVPPDDRLVTFSVPAPEEKTFFPNSPPAVSPDGRYLAFVTMMGGQDSLWVRALDSPNARLLPGTADAFAPFWSPDSRRIGFFSNGKLKKVDLLGGPATSLCDAPDGVGGTWSKSGLIIFGPYIPAGLLRVSADGGNAIPVTALDAPLGEIYHGFPWFLPDGKHFLYTAVSAKLENSAIYVGDINSMSRVRVMRGSSNAVYTQQGYLIFDRERTLMAQRFDLSGFRTIQDPVPIARQVDEPSPFAQKYGLFSVSQTGVLLFSSGNTWSRSQLTWLNRSGKAVGTVGMPGVIDQFAISPDGWSVAVIREQTGSKDLWLHDLRRDNASRLTFNSSFNFNPVWSPDGRSIAFSSNRNGSADIYKRDTSGSVDQTLLASKLDKFPSDWSRDGRYILFHSRDKGGWSIWIMPLFGDRKPFPYLSSSFSQSSGILSPNGRWLAYVSDETKTAEIYVQGFPDPGAKYQLSQKGGSAPSWSASGRELFFISGDRKLMAIPVNTSLSRFEYGLAKPLFDIPGIEGFDVSKDGRFLIATPVEQTTSVPMTVVINWPVLLKK